MTYLRQRFDELLDIGDTLSAKNVSQTMHIIFTFVSCGGIVLFRATYVND